VGPQLLRRLGRADRGPGRGLEPVFLKALLEAGLDEATVGQVMGGNVVRLLRATLP
jgi:hypothetical protein